MRDGSLDLFLWNMNLADETSNGSKSGGGCVIRAAVVSDVAAIKECAVAAYSKYIERIGKSPAPMMADFQSLVKAGHVSVACCEKNLVGYVVFYRTQNAMHLENVAVYPDFVGRGIGKSLIRYVEKRAADIGVGCVELYTNAAMTENLALYPALGYEEYDRRVEDGFNRVYFRTRL